MDGDKKEGKPELHSPEMPNMIISINFIDKETRPTLPHFLRSDNRSKFTPCRMLDIVLYTPWPHID